MVRLMSLTKEQIFAKRDRVIESVPVPEWGGEVHVRRLKFSEQTAFEAECAVLDPEDTEGAIAASLASYMCDEQGEPILTIAELRKELPDLEAVAVSRVMAKGQELNRGLTPEAVEKAKGKS
jgi:hypothetical protein